MINNAAFPPVGILGLGFLGQILAREFSAVPESWGTWHKTQLTETPLPVFLFDWGNENSWSVLPETAATLVLTIPPLLKNPETEAERLHLWGKWMSHNRPELKRMIYISTTGVYPKCNGIWSEDSEFEADTNSGKLRLLTENILSNILVCKSFVLEESMATDAELTSASSPESRFLFQILRYTASMSRTLHE